MFHFSSSSSTSAFSSEEKDGIKKEGECLRISSSDKKSAFEDFFFAITFFFFPLNPRAFCFISYLSCNIHLETHPWGLYSYKCFLSSPSSLFLLLQSTLGEPFTPAHELYKGDYRGR